jgi:hypothetical protein
MVFIVKPGFVSSLERSVQRKIDEVAMQARLVADTTDNFLFGSTRLKFQEKVVLEM